MDEIAVKVRAADLTDGPIPVIYIGKVRYGGEGGRSIDSGSEVEVRSRFDQSWSHGFEVVEQTDHGYRVRRVSDGVVLPAEFIEDDVRQATGSSISSW